MGILLALGFGVLLWAVLGDPVTELPFGMQTPLQAFINSMTIAYNVFPPLETPFTVLIIGLGVKVSMFIFRTSLTIIQILRG